MNFKSLSLSVIAALAISAAPAYAITDAQQATLNQAIAAQASLSTAELVAVLIAENPELAADIVTSVIEARPCLEAVSQELGVCSSVTDAVQAAIAAAPEYADAIVAAAITAAPDSAAAIVTAAINAGADAADVVTAAVAAGADPTVAATASAAGPNTPADTQNANARRVSTNSGSGVSPS